MYFVSLIKRGCDDDDDGYFTMGRASDDGTCIDVVDGLAVVAGGVWVLCSMSHHRFSRQIIDFPPMPRGSAIGEEDINDN